MGLDRHSDQLQRVALIASAEGGGMRVGSGALLIVAAAACAATQFYLQKPLLERYSPAVVIAYMMWAGALISFTDARTGVRHDGTCGAPQQCCGHFVGVFPAAIAYASWSVVLASFPLGRAAGFLYLIPPCAMLFSYLWLREVPGKASLIGGSSGLVGGDPSQSIRTRACQGDFMTSLLWLGFFVTFGEPRLVLWLAA